MVEVRACSCPPFVVAEHKTRPANGAEGVAARQARQVSRRIAAHQVSKPAIRRLAGGSEPRPPDSRRIAGSIVEGCIGGATGDSAAYHAITRGERGWAERSGRECRKSGSGGIHR